MRESRQFFDSVILPYPKDKRQLFILQEFLENDGLVMDFILRTIKKRHRALLKFFPDKGNELLRIRISRKFFRISFLELLEFFRIMAEPFPKLRRWGNRLVPDTERAFSLEMPLGQSLSVKIRKPSDSSGASYTRFTCTSIRIPPSYYIFLILSYSVSLSQWK